MFFEMRFDLGTLDSGERSLPFGLLVYFLRMFAGYNYLFKLFFLISFSLQKYITRHLIPKLL